MSLAGVVWPPPPNPKSGHAFYVSVNKDWAAGGIYTTHALSKAVERKTGSQHPWRVGSQGDGHGFPQLHQAITFWQEKFPKRSYVMVRWA